MFIYTVHNACELQASISIHSPNHPSPLSVNPTIHPSIHPFLRPSNQLTIAPLHPFLPCLPSPSPCEPVGQIQQRGGEPPAAAAAAGRVRAPLVCWGPERRRDGGDSSEREQSVLRCRGLDTLEGDNSSLLYLSAALKPAPGFPNSILLCGL